MSFYRPHHRELIYLGLLAIFIAASANAAARLPTFWSAQRFFVVVEAIIHVEMLIQSTPQSVPSLIARIDFHVALQVNQMDEINH